MTKPLHKARSATRIVLFILLLVPGLLLLSGSTAAASDHSAPPELIIVLDVSGSMNDEVPEGHKLLIALVVIEELYREFTAAVGPAEVLAYADCGVPLADALSKWTVDWEIAKNELLPGGNTPTGRALQAALLRLGYLDIFGTPTGTGEGTIILVSDGQSNCSFPEPDPCELVASLSADVRVHTVGYILAGDRRAAEEELRCIADATHSVAVTVDTAEALLQELQRLARLEVELVIPNGGVSRVGPILNVVVQVIRKDSDDVAQRARVVAQGPIALIPPDETTKHLGNLTSINHQPAIFQWNARAVCTHLSEPLSLSLFADHLTSHDTAGSEPIELDTLELTVHELVQHAPESLRGEMASCITSDDHPPESSPTNSTAPPSAPPNPQPTAPDPPTDESVQPTESSEEDRGNPLLPLLPLPIAGGLYGISLRARRTRRREESLQDLGESLVDGLDAALHDIEATRALDSDHNKHRILDKATAKVRTSPKVDRLRAFLRDPRTATTLKVGGAILVGASCVLEHGLTLEAAGCAAGSLAAIAVAGATCAAIGSVVPGVGTAIGLLVCTAGTSAAVGTFTKPFAEQAIPWIVEEALPWLGDKVASFGESLFGIVSVLG